MDKIEVEYFIVKRKLYENLDFPQKRVQKFVPQMVNHQSIRLKDWMNFKRWVQ